MSSTLVSIGKDLGHPLTTFDKTFITCCTCLGALIASPVAGLLADRIGRKPIIMIADVLFINRALCQSAITGSGLADATNCGSDFVVSLTFLPMMDYLTPV